MNAKLFCKNPILKCISFKEGNGIINIITTLTYILSLRLGKNNVLLAIHVHNNVVQIMCTSNSDGKNLQYNIAQIDIGWVPFAMLSSLSTRRRQRGAETVIKNTKCYHKN